ncbi:MAG: sigma-70 family RNA polymerase sigma factor [Planctomycetota bacterium]
MNDSDLHELLAETHWLRRLALRLADQATDADDIVQDTLVEAIDRPPQSRQRLREWLATVLRHRVARNHRQRKRRVVREQRVASPEVTESTADIVARLELQRELTRIVLELPENTRSVLLLRYFEELPPRHIATRLAIPVETVRTRLRRSLSQLRDRLDSRFGDRNSWTAVFLVRFGEVPKVTSTLGWLGSPITQQAGAVVMNSSRYLLATIVAVLTLGIGIFWIAQRSRDADLQEPSHNLAASLDPRSAGDNAHADAGDPSEELEAARTGRRALDRESDSNASTVDDDQKAHAEADASSSLVRGRVVDVEGNPLPGIAVHWAGPNVVHYSDSLETWLESGGRESIRWTPELQRRLELEPAYADSFFLERSDPEEWRAMLLGGTSEGRGAISGSDGTFEFPLGTSAPRPGRIMVVQKGMRAIASGLDDRGELVLVTVPIVSVAGRVTDVQGRSFAGSRLTYHSHFDLRALPIRIRESDPPAAITTVASDNGNYILREIGVLPSARIEVTHNSAISQSIAIPSRSQEAFGITLEAVGKEPRSIRIRGYVVDSGSQRVPNADMFYGSIRSRCDEKGAFDLEVPLGGEPRSLIAVARGHRPAILEAFTASLDAGESDVIELEVRLPGTTQTIEGRILDSRGSPLAGISLNLFDPTLPDTSFSSLEMLSAGRREVRSGPDGEFRIEGLEPRAYRLRLWSEEPMLAHVTDPIAAGETGVDLVVPELPRLAPAVGRILDREGRPVEGAKVAFGFTTFQPRNGWQGLHGPTSTTDSDGRFTLDLLPLRHVFLEVKGDSILPIRVPIESLQVPGPLDVMVDRACVLSLHDDSTAPCRLRVTDEAGATQKFRVGRDLVEWLDRDRGATWPRLWVAASARSIELTRGDRVLRRIAMTPDPLRSTTVDVSAR